MSASEENLLKNDPKKKDGFYFDQNCCGPRDKQEDYAYCKGKVYNIVWKNTTCAPDYTTPEGAKFTYNDYDCKNTTNTTIEDPVWFDFN